MRTRESLDMESPTFAFAMRIWAVAGALIAAAMPPARAAAEIVRGRVQTVAVPELAAAADVGIACASRSPPPRSV